MARRWIFPDGYFSEESGHLVGPRGEESLEPRVASLLQEFLRHPGEVLSHDHML